MENKENKTFSYTYSAKEQEEVKAIRKKYVTEEQPEDKMVQLRRLDAAVTQKATMFSLIAGILGALILGTGMSLAMTEIGSAIGLGATTAMALGIVIGVIGLAFVGAAYPLYNRITKKEREKIAPEIIRLSDELMK